MKQSSKRLVSMLLALVFLVVAFLIFFDLVQSTYGDLQTKKGTQLSAQAFLQNEQSIVTQAKNLISQYQNESQAQQNLGLAMPSGPSVASALAQIYGIAQISNLAVQNISISPPMVQSTAAAAGALTLTQIMRPMGTISFQVSATGSYESLKNFLSQLETNLRIFDLTSFSLQAAAATGGKGTVATPDFFTYNFTVATYYQLP